MREYLTFKALPSSAWGEKSCLEVQSVGVSGIGQHVSCLPFPMLVLARSCNEGSRQALLYDWLAN